MNDEVQISKTERKRRATRMHQLGRSLTELNAVQLATIPASLKLQAAIKDYQRFSSNEAKRRQLQFIGKLVRDEDTEGMELALARLDGTSALAQYEFHQLEIWRDRLIEEPGSLTEYLREHPTIDRQALRHRIAHVQRAKNDQQRRTSARALFRFLREAQDGAPPSQDS